MSKVWASRSLLTARHERTPVAPTSNLVSLLGVWRRRLRCRRELSTLTHEQMRDTDLDPETIRLESSKPFWKA